MLEMMHARYDKRPRCFPVVTPRANSFAVSVAAVLALLVGCEASTEFEQSVICAFYPSLVPETDAPKVCAPSPNDTGDYYNAAATRPETQLEDVEALPGRFVVWQPPDEQAQEQDQAATGATPADNRSLAPGEGLNVSLLANGALESWLNTKVPRRAWPKELMELAFQAQPSGAALLGFGEMRLTEAGALGQVQVYRWLGADGRPLKVSPRVRGA